MQQSESIENFVASSINNAKKNLAMLEDQRMETKDVLKVAGIQAELAKAGALVMIAQAIQSSSTQGNSIRYGMAEVAGALKSLRENGS